MLAYLFGPATLRIALLGLALSAIATPIVRALARRFGFVAAPKKDRWHQRPTAMMGGVAIFIAAMVTFLVFVPQSRSSWAVLGASTLLFAVGLIEDIVQIKPYHTL